MMSALSLTLIFESNWIYLPILRKIIKEIGKEKFKQMQEIDEIAFSLHEAVCNIICHAYQNELNRPVELSVNWDDQEFSLQLSDRGLAHNPQTDWNLSCPELSQNEEALAEDGRGIFLIHHFMDEVHYRHENGLNILLLKKWIR